MLNSFRISTLAAALAVATVGFASTGSQAASAPDLRGTEFDRPDVVVYSWGLEVGNDMPTDYTWSEINRRIAATPAVQPANSRGIDINHVDSKRDLRGTRFDRPDVIVYSWGLEVGNDMPTDYTWQEVNRLINIDQNQR